MQLTLRVRLSLQGILLGLAISAVSSAAGDLKKNQLSVTSVETVTPVIELYTSEGCSSCPTADRFISQLGSTLDRDFHAVPLAFHVDYWDRLGWKDPYSKPKFTARQREIGALNNQSSVYTPEIVVAGKESRGGLDIVERITYSNSQKARVAINLHMKAESSTELMLDYSIDNQTAGNKVLGHIAIYENHIVRKIAGGENNGLTLTHDFVVRHWSNVIELPFGKTNKTLSLEIDKNWVPENLGLALIVIDANTGDTLQAVNASLDSIFQI